MSLLIKALDKAEKAQVEQKKLEHEAVDLVQSQRRGAKNIANDQIDVAEPLSLTMAETLPDIQQSESFVRTQYSGEHTSTRATNMFAAKVESSVGIKPIVWILLIGALGFLAIVGYFYYQLNVMQAPPAPVVNPPAFQASNPQDNTLANLATPATTTVEKFDVPSNAEKQVTVAPSTKAEASTEIFKVPATSNQEQAQPKLAATAQTTSSNVDAQMDTPPIEVRRTSQTKVVPTIASDSASIRISRSQPAPAVSPVLMRAYNAYLAGKDNEAQNLYKQVLQRDTRNIDALLGLGAIAERQGRMNDAFGWYQKVLELDPKNAIALSAYASGAPDDQSKALKLKQMLAENPKDANTNANLGAYYAEQLQWSEAQQAYFEAYRYNASAENAFNLAVSLDQMGKPALALPYYQQALSLAATSPSTTIDINALQARMSAIRSQQ
jgi:Tfp pilus assembly protein PilF